MTNETTASERERLKPCPFCGGPARWGKCVPGEQEMENDGAEYIECEKCGASTCLVFPCMDSAKPVLADRWNARAALPAPADQVPSGKPMPGTMGWDWLMWFASEMHATPTASLAEILDRLGYVRRHDADVAVVSAQKDGGAN